MKIPQEYLDSTYDFGFTAVDDDEVAEPLIQQVKSFADQETEKAVTNVNEKLLRVEKLIMPLLVNLLKDAETKHYIKWPNRKAPIENVIEKILTVTRS
tara:strand:+ start:2962 stop:3255 length:294 start_codon:yes stop_codon:yes gene_type:complete